VMRYDGEQVAKEFEEAFGKHINGITAREMWWLVKVIKHCRMRCRNNSALNNWLSRNFKNFRFSQVTKTKQNGETYEGLEITEREHN